MGFLWLCQLGSVLVVLIQVSQSQTPSLPSRACQQKDELFMNQTLEDLKKALSHRTLDVAFIMDISGSISNEYFNKIRLFVLELFNYAASECDMYIHPDYTRTEFILFDHMAELHVANYSRQIHGCEFLDILNNLQRPRVSGGTFIARAMQQALESFRRNSGDRPVESQVLFILTDGEFYDDPFEIELMSTRLGGRGQEVKVYTVGVGDWLSYDKRREDNLKALASNHYNYACVNDWLLLLNPGKAEYDPRAPIWALGTEAQQKECKYPRCSEHAQCACDVTRAAKGYQCACSPEYYLKNGECTMCPKGTRKEGIGNTRDLCIPRNDGTGSAAIAGMVVGLILLALLLAFCVLLICLARKGVITCLPDCCLCVCLPCCKRTKNHPYTEPGPGIPEHRPPPPVPTGAMTPSPGYLNPSYSVPGYEKPIAARRDSTLYENLQHVRTSGKTDELKGMEKYMEMACSSGTFTYLALYITRTEALVCSPGLILDVGQMSDVMMVMRGGKKGAEVTMMDRTFRVDRAQRNDYIHGQEVSVKRGGKLDRGGPSSLWVASMEDYVVLGIGPMSEDSNMENEVFNLRANMV